jgi:quercetin dioxygenase-like cupin family protein
MRNTKFAIPLFCVALAAPLIGDAQAPGLKRTILQKADLSAPGREVIMALAELPPGAAAGRHTHFGEEISYLLEGTTTLLIDGQPPRVIHPGESFIVPAGVIHDAKAGEKGGKVLATYIVEKGKPLATPAK